jgi:tetratricopeptide (TPR) repeat protein/predicted Ser/Thr protein kinase
MERLIAVMKGRPDAPTVADRVVEPPAMASDGRLAAVAWGAVNLSLPDGNDGEQVHAVGKRRSREQGMVIGRYVVLRVLGAGGMGVVYAAYDPELDRQVALKLVLPGMADSDGRTRLLREAQALAKLSHRNVVTIHDVGTSGEQVWLAMEFVRGQTLKAWLEKPRHWRDVLGVLRKAGRGLAAAHAAGLLHRDFKPDNVMVGERGRVWVMDFGLARARLNVKPIEAEEPKHESTPMVGALSIRVTQAGTLLGTPRYMAPEQFQGKDLTPTADQFSLCVTLWEGLYGERPFAGRTLDELADNVLAGRLQEPPKGRAVPGWLRRVCERGLSIEPQQRFASMEALLDMLSRGHTRARVRKGLAAVGTLAMSWAGAEGYQRYDIVQRAAACEASGAEVEVAWNDERRQKLHDALIATGMSYAPSTAEKVMPWFDRQADAWREARVEACLDAEVRGRWDAETLDHSLWCLDERRMQLESLVDELTLADAEVLQKAVPAAAGLTSVAACRDESVLELPMPPVADREAIREVRADVTWADSLSRAGRYGKGIEVARRALERAETLKWRPLSAGARFQLGWLLERTGAYMDAEKELERAYFEAADGVAPEVVVDAATSLVFVVGSRLARHAEGRRWGRHAEVALISARNEERLHRASLLNGLAAIHHAAGTYKEAMDLQERGLAIMEETLGSGHPKVAKGLNNLAIIHASRGAYGEAIELYKRALAIREDALGPQHPEVATTLMNLGEAHRAIGAYDEAMSLYKRALMTKEDALGREHPEIATILHDLGGVHWATGAYGQAIEFHERALAIREKALGPRHPDVAASLNDLAIIHRTIGTYDEAMELQERALAIQEETLGPEHPDVAGSLSNLAVIHCYRTSSYDEAKVLHERALAIQEKALGSEHPDVATTLNSLAIIHDATGSYDEAVALHERALAIREMALGPEHPDVAASLSNLAAVRESTGAYDEAKVLYERALAIREKSLDPKHPGIAYPLLGLASVALEQDRPTDAVPLALRAVTVREKSGVAAYHLANAHFMLARALWEAPADGGGDRARAIVLAKQARDAFRDAGKGGARELASVEKWLLQHGDRAERAVGRSGG